MRIITIDDFRDIYLKILQRGFSFILSKFSFSNESRTRSSFNTTKIKGSNCWDIPIVKQRWNFMITGDKDLTMEEYISKAFVNKRIKLLSLGTGTCSHELELAKLNPQWDITCIDFSDRLIEAAKDIANKKGLSNINFFVKNIYEYIFPESFYHVILFNSSLHHIKHLDLFIKKVHCSLKPHGHLIINEFVGANRLQYSRNQLKEINKCLALIDKDYRKLYKSNIYKNKHYGAGILRMIVSDPSECVESENILPVIHSMFNTIEEKGYGGNILMPVLKDISHNFIVLDERKRKSIEYVFRFEDEYLVDNKSDFLFGIYEKSEK